MVAAAISAVDAQAEQRREVTVFGCVMAFLISVVAGTARIAVDFALRSTGRGIGKLTEVRMSLAEVPLGHTVYRAWKTQVSCRQIRNASDRQAFLPNLR
jgi:hypothetical protein